MYMEYRQPLWIFPLCFAGSILLNFIAADNFPLFFSTQKRIVLPDMVEVDIELAPAEEEVVLTNTPIETESDLKAEDIDLSKLLAQKLPIPDLDSQVNFFTSQQKTIINNKIPEQTIMAKKIIDRSGEFTESSSAELSDSIDLSNSSNKEYAHFENVYVAVPKQKDVDHLADSSLPTGIVDDKSDNFEKREYGTLHADVDQARADQLIDIAALRAAFAAYQIPDTQGGGKGYSNVSAALVKPVEKRKLISSVKPKYPEWARKRGLEAIVVLRFSVLTNGSVSEKIYALQTSGYTRLDEVAIKALKKWKFNSIKGTDGAVEQWGQVAFHFKL